MIPDEHNHRFAYHFTLIENFDSILRDGILSTNNKNNKNILHKDIANQEIQQRRSKMLVTEGPGGVVHDYVPLYFAKRTPMLLSLVISKNIDQVDVIYFAVNINKILGDNVVFTDASANTENPPNFYSNPESLNTLDWPIIDSWDWTYPDDGKKNKKMAEMLVHEKIDISDISHIVVWDVAYRTRIQDMLEEFGLTHINVVTDFTRHFKHHYFCQRGNPIRTSLTTGPNHLKSSMMEHLKSTLELETKTSKFGSVEKAIQKIEENFECIKELSEISGMETDNPIHKEDVGTHSQSVAARVISDDRFEEFTKDEKDSLILAAYLHDIGKGPKSRWENGIQKIDEHHPIKSLPMLKRIFSKDIHDYSKKQLRDIFTLVTYDDLVGDIVANGRNKKELPDIAETKRRVDLLIAIAKADMGAITESWVTKNLAAIELLRQYAYDEIDKIESDDA